MLLSRFVPKNAEFGKLFAEGGQVALQLAQALSDLFQNYTDVETKVKHIRDLEHQADTINHRVLEALTETFITPFDREDIITLSNTLDEFIDAMEDAARKMWLYKIEAPTTEAKHYADVIVKQAQELANALPLIESSKEIGRLNEMVKKVKTLEDEADRISDDVQSNMYDNVTTVPEMIKATRWGEIYQLLEDATDQAQNVAKTIEGILLKNA